MDAFALVAGVPKVLTRSLEPTKTRAFTERKCFLRILDVPLTGEEGHCVAEADLLDDVKTQLDNLPKLDGGMVRVYVEEMPQDENLVSHLANVLGTRSARVNFASRFTQNSMVGGTVAALISQRGRSPRWLGFQNFLTTPAAAGFARRLLSGRTETTGQIEAQANWCSISLDEERAIILISFRSFTIGAERRGEGDQEAMLTQMGLCCRSILEASLCLQSISDTATRKGIIIQHLLLRYLCFHLELVNNFTAHVDARYDLKRHQRMDPRRISLMPSILDEFTNDTLFCEHIRESSFAITELVSAALELFSGALGNDLIEKNGFRRPQAEVRLQCLAQNRLASRLVERLESQVKFFELFRGVRDSMSVQLLTLLASIFLPMSLASGILSMQTRFAKLHYLLYDFCGVITIIGTLAVAVFLALKLFMVLVDLFPKARARFGSWQRYERMLLWPVIFIVSLLVLASWALVFTSFMVGMIKDVGLGLKILGFGCAAYLGFLLIALFLAACIIYCSG